MDFYELGKAAHDAGKTRSPILDKHVADAVKDMPVGADAVAIFTAFSDGWDAAHEAYLDRMADMRYAPYSEDILP